MQGFVQGRHQAIERPASPSPGSPLPDRKSVYENLKIKPRKLAHESKQSSRSSSLAPGPVRTSDQVDAQYGRPANIYRGPPEGLFPESTIDDDFDRSKTEEIIHQDEHEDKMETFEAQRGYTPIHQVSYPIHPHPLQAAQPERRRAPKEQNFANVQPQAASRRQHHGVDHISDRFEGQPVELLQENSKKRPRSDERAYDHPNEVQFAQDQYTPEKYQNGQHQDESESHPSSEAEYDEDTRDVSTEMGQNDSMEYTESDLDPLVVGEGGELEEALPQQQSSQPEQKPGPRPILPKWNDAKLKTMSCKEVQDIAWDSGAAMRKYQLPKEVRGKSLEEKIKHHVAMSDDKDTQLEFYRSLSTTEWEEAGAWFMNRFSEHMQEVIKKKAEKRALTEKFEAELDARHKIVQGKSHNIDKKLAAMKTSGQEVLRGKIA